MRKVTFILFLFMASASVHADMALKFFGTADANDLSPLAVSLMEDTGVDATGFNCFELPIYDLDSGNPVGIGVDCLKVFDGDDFGAMIEAKTFFFLPRGSLVNHGCTSARAFYEGVGDSGVTHMTGSIGPNEFPVDEFPDLSRNEPLASPCANAGGVVHATNGMAKFLDGAVRLSGAVNLDTPGEITFSCMFVLED